MKFNELGLSDNSVKVIEELGFDTPTDIQEVAIPYLLTSQNDFVGQAQTGTGKTAAFVFPLIERVNPKSKDIQVLILTPTRELANQVCEEFVKLGKYSGLKAEAIFGGTSYDRQIRNIRNKRPQVIVGTPGRVMDLMRKKIISFKKSEYLILDEADEMLNMGFFEDVQEVIKEFNKEKSLWMFSATMPPQIEKLIKQNFKKPFFVKTERKDISNADIEQQYYVVRRKYQREALCRLVDSEPDMYGIVFCRTKLETRELSDHLLTQGYSIESLHGDMGQNERDFAMKRFKEGKARLMVCTDVAARGIDVNNLSHVINYGLPQDFESYVHRTGRTGRAGLKGKAVTLVDPKGQGIIRRIEKFIGRKIALKKLPTVEDMKNLLVTRELEHIASVVDTVTEKGEEFRVDKSFDQFAKVFENLSKEDILKTMFTINFNKHLRKLNNIGDLNHAGERSGKADPGRRPRKGGVIARTGNVRLFLNMGKGDGLRLNNLIDDIAKQTGVRKKEIQNVDLKTKFSFLEVPQKYGQKFLSAKNLKINNKKVHFENTNK